MAFSQCAGIDNTVIICNKELNENYKSFDLFNILNGSPETGGLWSANNPINEPALDNLNGLVNLWRINRFGEHKFTYTNTSCNETSEITIFLGGYPGEDNVDGGANACSDDTTVDLFTFLDNDLTDISADLNGTWEILPPKSTALLNENIFNAQAAGVGTYSFTYTVDEVETCTSRIANVVLEVHRAPESGKSTDIIICDTDDLSPYTNVNLFEQISGYDPNGIWIDVDSTNQITFPTDHIINIQEIYDNFGSGQYNFEYTVYPTHGVCPESVTRVTVKLPQISGKFLTTNQCLNNDGIDIDIIHSNPSSLNMSYDLTYEIVNNHTNQTIYTGTYTDIKAIKDTNAPDGPLITLPSNIFTAGNYTIRTSNISNLKGLICNSYTVTEDTFTILNANMSIEDKCYETDLINVTISDLIDNSGNPSNDTVSISYLITDTTSKEQIVFNNQSVSFTDGQANLSINISAFTEQNSDYNIAISSASDLNLQCINLDFSVNRVPEDIKLDLQVDNTCNATDMKVIIDAPQLTNGTYVVSYEVTEIGNPTKLIENTITFTGGQANYNVDITNLNEGAYNVILKSTQNDMHPCRTQFDFEIQKNFSIGGIPDAPEIENETIFCLPDFLPNVPTLADITSTSPHTLKWYADETITTELPMNTVLVNGETYFASATNTNSNCESENRNQTTVILLSPQPVTSTNTNPIFCGITNPTITNLEAIANTGNLVWYDSATGGNLLTNDTPLTNTSIYYATESIQGCEYPNRLAFNVTVISPPTPVLEGTTLLCALANTTLLDFESSFTLNTNFDLVWYDSIDSEIPLDESDLLEEDITYYVVYKDSNTGCEGNRLPITVTLNNCNPEDYDFFIPDGFSPNNDGTNDQYYIPYIEYFYPDYQLEIFNRYGQSLFKGDINTPRWNGQNSASGNNVTNGVYFYILQYNKDNLAPKQGRIYLSK
ncbi:Ig_7 domain-containing protein [Tenacibaculum sp. 190524A02b]|uniref:Ig_7 domain-containing protein n=1 Tax=Tenacibaculum vairaonense TaxID=3137860 RepID=A0ABM9PKE0_9FLAO